MRTLAADALQATPQARYTPGARLCSARSADSLSSEPSAAPQQTELNAATPHYRRAANAPAQRLRPTWSRHLLTATAVLLGGKQWETGAADALRRHSPIARPLWFTETSVEFLRLAFGCHSRRTPGDAESSCRLATLSPSSCRARGKKRADRRKSHTASPWQEAAAAPCGPRPVAGRRGARVRGWRCGPGMEGIGVR